MRVGVLVETEEGLDWDSWRRTFRAAQELGFESVWISDHLYSPWSADRHGLDPWTALAVAAAETKRITLGTLVSPITFREPAIVARMAESVAALAGDRLVLGLGLGWNADEHARAGIAFPAAAERSQRLQKSVERIRCELGERHVPILIGGSGARFTLPIVARYADEWNLTTASPTEYIKAATQLNQICAEVGRDPREIRRSVVAGVLIGRDPNELERNGQRMRQCVPPLDKANNIVEEARQMGWLVGTADDITNQVNSLASAGVERVIVGHYDVEQVAPLELIAERVLPELA